MPRPPAAPEGLRRDLNLADTTLLVMGGIIGAGIFFTPRQVALHQPSVSGFLLTWAIGGVMAFTGARVFARLGSILPVTGGQYVYLREAYGRTVAFFFGWNLLAIVASGALALIVGISTLNLDLVLRSLTRTPDAPVLSPIAAWSIGVAIIGVFSWVNVRGVRLGASIHNGFMAVKILAILFIIGLGAAWHFFGLGPSGLRAPDPGPRASTLAPALLGALFSYGGWQNAAAVAGEVRDAGRILARAILLGTAGVLALYLGLNVSVVAILGVEETARTFTPVADAAGRVLGERGRLIIAGAVVVSTLGIAHGLLLMTPRVYYAMARDGVFFRACGDVHGRHGTPHVAILAQAGFAVLHWSIAIFWAKELDSLLTSLVLVDWIFFALAGGACLLLGRRARASGDSPAAAGGLWEPLIFLLLSVGVVGWTAIQAEMRHLAIAAAVFLAGGAMLLARRTMRG